MDRTRSFLQAVLGFDEFLGIRALTKAEVDVDRKGFAGLLRAGFARRLVRGVYAVAPPFAFGREPVPPPFEVAAALCRLHGQQMVIPIDVAEFVLGLRLRPRLYDVVGPFGWDGEDRLESAGVVLEPADPRIVSLSPAGQAVALAMTSAEGRSGTGPSDCADHRRDRSAASRRTACQAVALAGSKLTEERLREAANGVLGSTREWLVADLPSLTPEEREVAEAILAVPVGAPRNAPEGFVPPSEACPTVHGWRVTGFGNREVLAAEWVTGHPTLGDAPLSHSSLLVWIDEELGWARTLSRFYRLGERA